MLQPDLTTFWPSLAYVAVATFLAGGWYREWKNRKKPQSDIDLQDAQRQKTLAEAHKIVLDGAIDALSEAKRTIEEMKKREEDQQRNMMALHEEVKRLRGNGRA